MNSSRLISEQNSEYRTTMRNDIENMELKAALLESQKEYYGELELEIPDEPDFGVTIKFKSSGYEIPNRKFEYTDTIHSIYAYIEVYLYKNHGYADDLTIVSYPNIKLENTPDKTIQSITESKRIMLLLQLD